MRSTTIDVLLLTGLLAGLVYFLVDAFIGGSSAGWRQAELVREIEAKQAELVRLEEMRDTLEDRTQRLRGPVIDLELLDERLRAVFGIGHRRDVVLIAPEAAPSSRGAGVQER